MHGVKRIVICSSVVACQNLDDESLISAKYWTDPNGKEVEAYEQSKTQAEKAA